MSQLFQSEMVRKEFNLSPISWQIYLKLLCQPFVSYKELKEIGWPGAQPLNTESLRVHIVELRNKTKVPAEVIYNKGYYIPEPVRKDRFLSLKKKLAFLTEVKDNMQMKVKETK